MKDTLDEDQYTFFIISRQFLLRMRNVSEEEEIKTHLWCAVAFIKKSLGKTLQGGSGHT